MNNNVILILFDDLNAWIEPLGENPDVLTPNLKKFASESSLFSRAYCSAPYCNASRMGVFTGQLPYENQIYANEPYWNRQEREPLLMEVLRDRGIGTIGAGKVLHGVFDYQTATQHGNPYAKWVEKYNREMLWDKFLDFSYESLPVNRPMNGLLDFSVYEQIPKKYHGFDWGPLPNEIESELPDHKAVSWLANELAQNDTTPLFAALGIYKPHLPWHVPQKYFELYDLEDLSLPIVKKDDLKDVPEIPRRWVAELPDHELIVQSDSWRGAVQAYLASITYADFQLGRFLQALNDLNLYDDSLIIIGSDNGFHLGEKLHWRKFVLWEEATRVPLLLKQPYQKCGEIFDSPVSLIDIYSTILEYFQIGSHQKDSSVSLLKVLRQEHERGPVRMTWGRRNDSIRDGHWRYTRYRDDSEELYDKRVDAREWTNLALDQNYGPVLSKFRNMLEAT